MEGGEEIIEWMVLVEVNCLATKKIGVIVHVLGCSELRFYVMISIPFRI